MDQQESSVRHRHATNPSLDISTAERDEKTTNGAVKEQGGKVAPDAVKRRQSSSDGSAGWMAMLTKPVDPLTLAVFRFLFGAAMVVHIVRAVLTQDVIEANFQDFFPETNFHYYFAMNVWKPPVDVTWLIFWACAVSAGLLSIGFLYRLASLSFLFLFTYINLMEKARYNNHYYLYVLVSFLFLITDCHTSFSLDHLIARWRGKKNERTVPAWHLYIFRFQIFVCYFYGSIAKMNYDWVIRGEPCKTWFYRVEPIRQLAEMVVPVEYVPSVIGYFFSTGGLAFDFLIGFMLLSQTFRPMGFLLTFGFHLTNHFVFKIGTFPWVMMATNIIFIEPETASKIPILKSFAYSAYPKSNDEKKTKISKLCRPLLVLLFCYVTAQCLVPFRHWLYPGDVNWTMEGHQFSWRMMLNAEDVVLRTLIRPQDGAEVVHTGYQLNARQMKRMITDPEMILQYAQYLGREHMQTTGSPASVRLDMWRSLNNRPFQRWVDPSVDLTTTDYWAFHYAWLEPQLPDSALDFSEMDRIRAEARDHGKMASFFMDKPGGVFKTTLQAGGPCSNVTLLAVSGDVTVQVRKVHTPVPVGTEFALPATGGFHRVRTGGDGPAAVWAYLHDCSPGHFHDAMMMTSMDSWEL
ncbi:PREDICTED: vitamin K-dependent gamma-carboxylase-like isoform X2 [Branchiostoma belcheri]|nr:PREDICTED: vitamin K-dependent gamma-carboxylase-like isoform X2 [Branchiostoma belcheri]XP_019618969.1 PREDICTED: vitamin K-dependent gamma-carboxylase-like isoform X2 [Branchiostoma belcheri]XP_019618976.1 PREDICTED: vitamin K-dependent gamma-carboxylase-like isoform X2 [Branchiostoma belcheri]